jgi:hypothetical protein
MVIEATAAVIVGILAASIALVSFDQARLQIVLAQQVRPKVGGIPAPAGQVEPFGLVG